MLAKLQVLTGALRVYNSEETNELVGNPTFPHERKGGVGNVLTHESPAQELVDRWSIGSATTARMASPLEATFRLTFYEKSVALQYFVNEDKKLAIKLVPAVNGTVKEFHTIEANVLTVASLF